MNRQRILDTALHLFATQGYAETSLKEIANSVGIKAPSIYAHFASKEELLAEVYTLSATEHTAYFQSLTADAATLPPLERLHYLLTGVESYYRDRPELVDFSLRTTAALLHRGSPALSETFRIWNDDLAELVRTTHWEGCERGDFLQGDSESFTALFLCLMDGLFLQLKHYAPALYAEQLTLTWQQLSQLLTGSSETLA